MNTQKPVLFLSALLLMGGGAGLLGYMHGHQRLGRPAIETRPIPGTNRLEILLPQRVLDYQAKPIPVDDVTMAYLPKDTSITERRYTAPDGFSVQVNVVLMGADRTSLHKPQFCLAGIGWNIEGSVSSEERIHIGGTHPYDLPVMKLIARKTLDIQGRHLDARGVYVYWFVADGERTAEHWQRMWWMARDLIRTGVLQRWAYISFFSICPPGQEEATYQRMTKLIAAAAPKFEQGPGAPGGLSARE
jgi:Protein of unknown function (DUF3485)